MKKGLLMTLIIVLIISVIPFSLSAKEITIKLAHLNAQQPFDIPSAAMAAAFKSAVEANSNGEIKVDIFASGVLGKERETMVQVKSGIVQSYISSTGGMSTYYPMIDITNMPFVFSSYNVGYKVYDGPFGQALAADIEKKAGFHVLGFGESGGFFAITNSKREVRTPADMRGVKVRTMTVPLHMEIIKSIGGSPTPISWSEVYTSLQTGVIDGQMNPVSIINMAKFYEVQKFATLTNHIYAPYVWVMNPRFYNSLSAAHKVIIDDAARTAILAGRGLSRIIDSSEKGLPVLMAKMKVYVPTPAEMKQFRDLSVPAASAFLEKEYGKEGKVWIDKFLSAIADAERELGY
ncbi:MAG: DctP family TRAP transporter solute-binding subunit [Spirochaetia bacterium]|nr:DctP family TRAP transporter solute-binding subunit [Spirochaetia bacterium]